MRVRVVSQDPKALTIPYAPSVYLPELLRAMAAIEQATGFRWKVTSYVRRSHSHQHGISLDIAPVILERDFYLYAGNRKSDPVLYKRLPLVRKLERLALRYETSNYDLGVFIEPDHLHLQILKPVGRPKMIIQKWAIPKNCYQDTLDRMKLPDTNSGYLNP